MKTDEVKLREWIQEVGKRLYQARLAVAKSGNLSCRLDDEHILITATGTFLGALKDEDIVKVRLADNTVVSSDAKPSSELPLHSLVYKNFPAKVVVHCHPPLVNGYFAVSDSLEAHTFETRFYLGALPVVKQETPTVSDPRPVIEALKASNLVVLKNHGTVSMGDDFEAALSLTEALEEAVLVAAVARLFKKESVDRSEGAVLQAGARHTDKSYSMFSREHVEAIVSLVNQDPFIAQKGQELDLTVKLAIRLDQDDRMYRFNFEKGRIVKLDFDADAPFVISAPAGVWEMVFLGKLDPFVAVTQGKMKLQGQLGQLSRWYVPFSRLFELFKQVKIA